MLPCILLSAQLDAVDRRTGPPGTCLFCDVEGGHDRADHQHRIQALQRTYAWQGLSTVRAIPGRRAVAA